VTRGSYVNGTWYHPRSHELVRNTNPANLDDIIDEFPAAQATDVERAVEAAVTAFATWRRTPAPERARVVWRATEIARARHESLARMLTREEGKTLREARGEVTKGINVLEYYAGEGFRLQGQTLPSELKDVFTYTVRRPLGVVGMITPWNFPWALPAWKIAPALVAGNTVVFKPSELTPATAASLVEIFAEAGLPPGVLNMVVGTGAVVGKAIVDHPKIAAISFTGSNAVGEAIHAAAARRGAKVTCEMGGKNAVIVLADANLARAVPAIHGGAFGSTGQRCTATSRVIVDRAIKPQLLDALVAKARAVKVGDPTLDATDMGPAVSDKQFAQDLRYLEVGQAEGARVVLAGGRDEEAGNGYFVKPTIFDGVTRTMRIFQEEIFGPVLGLVEVNGTDEAIAVANDVRFGLSSSVFTESLDHAMRFVEETETGMIHVNEPTVGGEAQLPFGGIKATGVGAREMGQEGINFFTELRTVFINYSGVGERSLVR